MILIMPNFYFQQSSVNLKLTEQSVMQKPRSLQGITGVEKHMYYSAVHIFQMYFLQFFILY